MATKPRKKAQARKRKKIWKDLESKESKRLREQENDLVRAGIIKPLIWNKL